MSIKTFIGKNIKATSASIKSFKEQPLNSLGQLIPMGIVTTSVVGFIVSIIIFAIAGGYSNQIAAIIGGSFSEISESFTSGTLNDLMSGIVPTIISILLIAELLVLIISYYKTEGKVKKIIVSICLGIGIVLFCIAGFILAVAFEIIKLSEEAEMKIAQMLAAFDGVQTFTVINELKIIAIIGVVALIVYIILMLVSKHRWMIKNSAVALLISYIILPLVLLLAENIIPMIVTIVVFVVIIVIAFIVGKLFLGNEEVSDSSSSARTSDSSSKGTYSENKQEEKNQKVIKLDFDTVFWRDEGGYGIAVPQADCIYMRNTWGEKAYVCTVYDFEKGDVAIMNNGKRIMNVSGCKTPER